MLSVEGIYQNGELVLKEKVESIQPVKVVVTFLEEPKKAISLEDFSFAQSRKILKDLNSSLSDTLIEERRYPK